MTDATITIPDGAWRDDGDGRLFARLWINGTGHHLEAIPVRNDASADWEIVEDQYGAGQWYGLYGDLSAAFGGDGPFETVQIYGKRYAVFLSPFCE